MYLVKIGIQTLSTFCIDAETALCGVWPAEDWNFRWLNKIKSKDRCLFPLLLLDHENVQEDFTILATFITLEHVSNSFCSNFICEVFLWSIFSYFYFTLLKFFNLCLYSSKIMLVEHIVISML